MMTRIMGTCLIAALAVFGASTAFADAGKADLWAGLANGELVALMRHATAPGVGDPAGFEIDDCATQRNLSNAGRAQAKNMGERFRAHGIDTATVLASQWCRCLDTARLLDLGRVIATPSLNSFFRNRGDEPARTAAVRRLLTKRQPDQPWVLVTHQVNITALTGAGAMSGEIVVVEPSDEGLRVAGRIAPP